MRKDSLITLGLLALAALQIRPVRADAIVVTLNSPVSASPGDTVTFTGTIAPGASNTNPVFLNGDALGSVPTGLIADDTPFLTSFALGHYEIDPGSAPFAGGFLDIFVALGQSPGLYTGFFNVLGGSTLDAQNVLATVEYSVTVIPEPGSLAFLGAGVAGLLGAAVTIRRKSGLGPRGAPR
jgi:hypothetical protein